MGAEHAADTEAGRDDPAGLASGWWPSPWPASMVAAGKVGRSGLQAAGGGVYWIESRPDDGGRQVVVGAAGGQLPVDISPVGVSVGSRVHEYGGGAATVAAGALFYVNQDDQRWYRVPVPGSSGSMADSPTPGAPVSLSPPPPADGPSCRYADGRLAGSGQWLVSVEERVGAGRTGHRLMAVGVQEPAVVPMVEEGDFVGAPRVSGDGRWLAWVTWDHPCMPWDSSEVWVARIEESGGSIRLRGGRRVAGGEGTSVGQPLWCRDGSLLFVDDRSGWWLPYRLRAEQLAADVPVAHPLVARQAEFHAPDWVLGQATMAELSDGSVVCRMHEGGRDHLVCLRPPESADDAVRQKRAEEPPWSIDVIDQPCVSISGVAVTQPEPAVGPPGVLDRVWLLGSTATESQAVFEIPVAGGDPPRRISTAPAVAVSSRDVSVGRPFTAATPSGPVPGLFFAPRNAHVEQQLDGGSTGLPPLVVFCHGGPTAAAVAGFDPVVQFFTSRGLAVAVVDYRGSTGYGRAYRLRLLGMWGEGDVDDCVHYAGALADAGWVDGSRMAIRGTSAGGLTALAALIRSQCFAGAAAWYGVTDLEALAADTHDFESRYVDSLVGPWPEAAETYRARSPIHHPDRVAGEVLLLQGADDRVVPRDQSERFAAMLHEHGIPCRLVIFEGESHGFRRAATIEACLTAELDFYRSLFSHPVSPEPTPTAP
ncbi:MAG: S9 family peptidase [Acidimicrobiales bacterium]|nr:S9 family peptidase [Acidimicrobiales bacterium]